MVKNKKNFKKLERRRQHLIEYLLSNVKLICGSYSDVLVRCGRPGCHCERKPIHPITRLEVRRNGTRQTKLVRADDRETVKQLVDAYKEHKSVLRELLKIQEEQRGLLKNLISEKDKGYK